MDPDTATAWATGLAVVVIAICVTVGVVRNGSDHHDERMQLRELRARVVESCQREPDTDLQECVDTNVALVESGVREDG